MSYNLVKLKKEILILLKQLFNLIGLKYQFVDLINIVLYVNSICNLKCLMCDVGQQNKRGIDRLRLTQKEQNLKLDLLNKLLNDPYIARRKIRFILLMTEPLLHPSIYEIVKLIKDRGHNVVITTNGYLLPEKAAGLISSGLDSIQVSIDGPSEMHDFIRGVKGAYKKAIQGIRILNQKKDLNIIINCTISCLNESEIVNFLDKIDKENIKIDLIKFQFMDFVSKEMASKHNKKYKIKQDESTVSGIVHPAKVNVKELSKQLNSIRNNYKNIKKIHIIPYIDDKQMFKYFNTRGEKIEGNSKCFMPWHSFALNTDGKVMIHMRCFNFIYGDFTKNNIKQIFHNDKISWFRKELKKANYCFPACTRCCGVMRGGEKWAKSN